MAITYEPISTTTLGSDTASVTFSSIPGTYTDLILVTNVSVTVNDNAVRLQFNNDTASNYSTTTVYGDGSSAASNRASNVTSIYSSFYVDPNANVGHNTISQIMNYSNSTTYKTVIGRANRATANNFPGAEAVAGLWRSTSAITEIDILTAAGGNFKTGSTFSLYGIKSA